MTHSSQSKDLKLHPNMGDFRFVMYDMHKSTYVSQMTVVELCCMTTPKTLCALCARQPSMNYKKHMDDTDTDLLLLHSLGQLGFFNSLWPPHDHAHYRPGGQPPSGLRLPGRKQWFMAQGSGKEQPHSVLVTGRAQAFLAGRVNQKCGWWTQSFWDRLDEDVCVCLTWSHFELQ